MHVYGMPLITPAEATEIILSNLEELPSEKISFRESLGRILREPLSADRAFPPFDRVTMDGIAFKGNGGSEYRLHGLHPAGAPISGALPSGMCWQIMTGASLPLDCDTVVPYEEVEFSETHARLTGDAVAGRFIHRVGTDAQAGDLLVERGTRIGPAQLGLAASVGLTELEVTRRPRIHILSTGDEMISPEETPEPHQLRQSNGLTLKAAIEEWGAAEITLTHLPDDLEATTQGIKSAMTKSDLVILSGGISKGLKDYVRPAIESLVGEPLFHGVAQRPGKPLAFWPGVAALPGNPNSTLIAFHRYLVPALDQMVGKESSQAITLPLEAPVEAHERLTLLLPSIITGDGKIRPMVPQNSGDFVTPMSATGFVEISPGTNVVTQASYRSY